MIEAVRRRPWLLPLPGIVLALIVIAAVASERPAEPASAPVAPVVWATAAPAPPTPSPPADPAVDVAIAFAGAFASYRWDDPADAVRQRVRPYVTDALDRALADSSSAAWLAQQRAERHEVASATVERVTSEGDAPDGRRGMIAQLQVEVHSDSGTATRSVAYELFLVRQPDGWRIDEVRL